MKKKQIAIIPARGGSKRIEKKNLIDFCGKPMIAWTIEAALESGQFSEVVVSTDDDIIAEVARDYGASIPFIRTKYTDDYSPISDVTLDSLDRIKNEFNEEYEVVVQLMANCPLRKSEHITGAISDFYKKNAPVQISCFRFGWMNPWWATILDDEGKPEPLFPESYSKRSQDLANLYCPTGAIWIANIKHLEEHRTFYSGKHIFRELPWEAAIDIDDYSDLNMATVLYNMKL